MNLGEFAIRKKTSTLVVAVLGGDSLRTSI